MTRCVSRQSFKDSTAPLRTCVLEDTHILSASVYGAMRGRTTGLSRRDQKGYVIRAPRVFPDENRILADRTAAAIDLPDWSFEMPVCEPLFAESTERPPPVMVQMFDEKRSAEPPAAGDPRPTTGCTRETSLDPAAFCLGSRMRGALCSLREPGTKNCSVRV